MSELACDNLPLASSWNSPRIFWSIVLASRTMRARVSILRPQVTRNGSSERVWEMTGTASVSTSRCMIHPWQCWWPSLNPAQCHCLCLFVEQCSEEEDERRGTWLRCTATCSSWSWCAYDRAYLLIFWYILDCREAYITYNRTSLAILVMFGHTSVFCKLTWLKTRMFWHTLDFFEAYIIAARQVSSCISDTCLLFACMLILVWYWQGSLRTWQVDGIHTQYLAGTGNTIPHLPGQTCDGIFCLWDGNYLFNE